MATASEYKYYNRMRRSLITEEAYKSGMMYTNNTLPDNYLKTIVNCVYNDDGNIIKPRGGFTTQSTVNTERTGARTPLITASALSITKLNDANVKDYRTRAFITVSDVDKQINVNNYKADYNDVLFKADTATLCIQDPSTDTYTISTPKEMDDLYIIGIVFNKGDTVHGYSVEDSEMYSIPHTVLNNALYLMCKHIADDSTTVGMYRLSVEDDGGVFTHKLIKVEATELSPKEVINTGYNMLAENPYEFKNEESSVYDILGILPYTVVEGEEERTLLLSARQGQAIEFEVYYKYKKSTDKKLRARWEWIDPNSTAIEWSVLQAQKPNDTVNPNAPVSPDYTHGDSITIVFEPTVEQFQLRVSLYEVTGSTVADAPVKVMVMPLYKLTSNATNNTANLKPVAYNLETAIGMTTWKQRMVLWGVTGAENVLFTSEVNNPGYFPYPNNIDIFDENIIHVVEYTNSLLVFTTTKVYIATLLEDGIGFSTNLIQNRLNVAPIDAQSIQVIKTMVYFKSGNYYYMIVPKINSYNGELTLAPVSKPITYFLDNFNSSLKEILEIMYPMYYNNDEYSIVFKDYHNFVDGNNVRNLYVFDTHITSTTSDKDYIKIGLCLNYDTMLRVWTVWLFQCDGRITPVSSSVTDGTVFVTTHVIENATVIELLKISTTGFSDATLLSDINQRVIRNYQYIDTGYRTQAAQHKKRFREVQFKFNNISQRMLKFYTEFIIDDQLRQTYYKYTTQHITDPDDPNYGLIYVTREQDPTMTVAGRTLLAAYEDDYSSWTLDQSKFPPTAVVKVRFFVSGKGYAPRIKLLSFNEKEYELININWVSRAMYAR